MPDFATDSAAGVPAPDARFRDSIAYAAYEEAGLGPEDMRLAEVYDLSSALELDWYENIGLCKPGEAEKLLRRRRHRQLAAASPSTRAAAWLLRRGGAGPGARPGLRADLAAARPGGRATGREARCGHHGEPGPLRPRLIGLCKVCSRPGTVPTQASRAGTPCTPRNRGTENRMAEAYIIDAVRTPVGRSKAKPLRHPPADLGAHVLKALVERTQVDPGAVEDVIFGCCRHDRSAGGRHRAHLLARGGPARSTSPASRSIASAARPSSRSTSPRRP